MTDTTATTGTKTKLRGLGRGLESLLPSAPRPVAASVPEISAQAAPTPVEPAVPAPSRMLPIARIDLNPRQTRRRIDPETFADLMRSIQNDGVLLPITVRPVDGGRYQISSGQRRFTAAKELGMEEIHAIVKPQTDEEAFVTTIVENMQREDLSPLEQAYAFKRLQQDFGYTQEQIAQQVGKDRSTVTNCLTLLNLPEEMQQALEEGKLTSGHAKALLGLKDRAMLLNLGRKIIADGTSVRKTEAAVQQLLRGAVKQEPKVAPPVDPNVRDAQEQLQRALGLKVTVEDREGRGRVVIEYSSLDDFEVLMNRLGQKE